MLSEATEVALRDILRHIELAEQFVGSYDWGGFRSDIKTVYAVTRCLEIISEASRRLPAELRPGIPQLAGKKWPPPEMYIVTNTKT